MSSTDTERFDPSRRRLCPDGACIGLLDDAGTCRECGLTASGDRVELTPRSGDDIDEVDQLEDAALLQDDPAQPPRVPGAQAQAEQATSGGFDPKRRLCPDGACVGVIGPDGRCKVCGKQAS
jgi:hypothetical protein